QVDTPDRIYHAPDTVAVAEFIGSPRINLVDGTYDGRAVRTESGSVPIELPVPAGQALRLGFRCESASLTAPGCGRLDGEVAHVENLGSDLLVHVRCAGSATPVVVRMPAGSRPAVRGEHVGVDTGSTPLAFGPDGDRIGAPSPATAQAPRSAPGPARASTRTSPAAPAGAPSSAQPVATVSRHVRA
ncbi:MAG: ABC transporter ATP-binding protein, partial [Burkholderiales bacterium]